MKAAIVLLASDAVQNVVRRIAFDLEQKYHVDMLASLLPAHVSLKQAFSFERMDTLEAYFDTLAARTSPLEITLDALYSSEWNGYGILGMQVVETPELRALHNQLNRELPAVVLDPSAPHDGESYRFHMTIEMGKLQGSNPFQAFYDQIGDKSLTISFRTERLAMFYYTDKGYPSFMTYKILPLKG